MTGSDVDHGADGTVTRQRSTIPSASHRRRLPRSTAQATRPQNSSTTRKEKSMKTIQFLKAAGGIACVAFALNATAQTSASPPPATSETVGEHIDDGTLTTKVKAELLGAKNVKSTHIHVKSRNGVVWLTGSVPSPED